MHHGNLTGRLLTTAEVAERLDVSRGTVLNWCRAGDLTFVRYPSGQYRIPVSEVERILTPVAASSVSAESPSDALPGQGALL
ncbi:helix-turn-helix domain-containing protein [Trueperella pyogenes]|uniref:helix-turn-helix domain-containing protein n=1 Tax=Trueperella pyogenes TaxID=1661 RepID=UPI00345CD60B